MQEIDQKKMVLDFIKSQKLATLATVGADGNPEAATVAISETNDLSLVFGCYATARKYQNLISNQNVAVVFSQDKISVQYEGKVKEVVGEETKRLQDIHIAKHADSAKHSSHPAEKYFIVTPVWIRYMNHSTKPDLEFEIKF
ncbi:MAG: pyridoxamine 5'-phosphate oxidase family protein [Patescibacteria group bacterium]|nr:pyridoxamine 5'-phosphate oxidase family protein [Patescibacteria group bacterium]